MLEQNFQSTGPKMHLKDINTTNTTKTQETNRMTEKFDRLNLQNLKTPSKLRKHPTKKMTAGVYRGKKSIVYEDVPMPTVTDPTDAVIRITMAAVCGSDLHLYHGELPNKYVDG